MTPRDRRPGVEQVLRDEVERLGRVLDAQENALARLRQEASQPATRLGRRLQQWLDPRRQRYLGRPLAGSLYRAVCRVIEIWAFEGLPSVAHRARRKVRSVLLGRRPGIEGRALWKSIGFEDYGLWLSQQDPSPTGDQLRAVVSRFTRTPLVSMLVSLPRPAPQDVDGLVEMLRQQAYEQWELRIAVPESSAIGLVVDEPRLQIVPCHGETSLAEAASSARGEFIGILEAGDHLASDALVELVARLDAEPDVDAVYSDEDVIADDGTRTAPFFKPDWSPDLLLSVDYMTHAGLYRRRVVDAVGGFRRDLGQAEAFDLVLRVTEATERIAHVPRVLCHRRQVPVTADGVISRHAANWDECRALEEALARRGRRGHVTPLYARRGPRCYMARFDLRGRPLVSIIIPTRNKQSLLQTTLESIWQRTDYDRYEIIAVDNDSTEPEAVAYLASLGARCRVLRWSAPFNYSAINNFAVRHARGEQLLFLNNDMEVTRSDWLTALLEHAQRPEVGAVGARLLYGDGRIQHAGIVVGINRAAANAFRTWPGETIGAPRLVDLVRNCSAVTGACMMVPRRVFDEVGGFREGLRVALNDVDLCLRIRKKGYLVVYTPHATLNHYEGSSRGLLHPATDQALFEESWDEFLRSTDPYYNPNLTRVSDDWSLNIEDAPPE